MFKFEWSELVTDEVMDKLQGIAGEDIANYRDEIKIRVTTILANSGGLPVSEVDLTVPEMTQLAERLLADAIGHYLAIGKITSYRIGHYVEKSDHPRLDAEIKSMPVVDVNRADEKTLDALPTIGQQRAKAILRERTEGGYFQSLDDLELRVDGVGETAKIVLQHITNFEVPVGALPAKIDGDLLTRRVLRALEEFSAIDNAEKLFRLLDSVASVVSASPHPSTARLTPRAFGAFPLEPLTNTAYVGVLAGTDYYNRLPGLLRAATGSIKVVMFHVAFPSENHPTKALLDELVIAKDRGVNVKVLLDRDRETDPYMSTVINAAAKEYLESNGVACRFDAEEVLLHSKLIVVDESQSIIGSHNWSAGSYFHFDDISFVVESSEFAARLVARFNRLWG